MSKSPRTVGPPLSDNPSICFDSSHSAHSDLVRVSIGSSAMINSLQWNYILNHKFTCLVLHAYTASSGPAFFTDLILTLEDQDKGPDQPKVSECSPAPRPSGLNL